MRPLIAVPLQLVLRLELLPPDSNSSPAVLAHLLRYVVVDGLASTPLPSLASGQSTEVRMSLCLMAQGRYEFGCSVEELDRIKRVEDRKVYTGASIVIEVDR